LGCRPSFLFGSSRFRLRLVGQGTGGQKGSATISFIAKEVSNLSEKASPLNRGQAPAYEVSIVHKGQVIELPHTESFQLGHQLL
jgi:hypothetical protein